MSTHGHYNKIAPDGSTVLGSEHGPYGRMTTNQEEIDAAFAAQKTGVIDLPAEVAAASKGGTGQATQIGGPPVASLKPRSCAECNAYKEGRCPVLLKNRKES